MGYKDENQSDADHAVDELAEVLVSLEDGEDAGHQFVSESRHYFSFRSFLSL